MKVLPPLRPATLAVYLLVASLTPGGISAADPSPSHFNQPIRVATTAFGEAMEIEIRDLPTDQAEQAVQAVVKEIRKIERLTANTPSEKGGVAQLNEAGEKGLVLDQRLFALLERALNFCFWSRGAHGPVGGPVYRLWGVPSPADSLPTATSLTAAAARSSCNNLKLDIDSGRATLAPGTTLELRAFTKGFALDQAMRVLAEHGSNNAYVELGTYRCGAGDGPEGQGWRALLPSLEGIAEDFEDVWLSGQCMTSVRFDDHPLTAAGETFSTYLDQRSGRPSEGVAGVVAVTELAADAEGLAASLLILGQREGQMRLGGLKPAPSILWLLGTGTGAPLLSTYHWADLRTR
ncbi:MAG: FAD:protein FMN transferase [Deltaproteobacteria bacterium]|nr:FAD:protein FMN transferase [Deltaproteobacteria bacterium]